ncbi:unnamed protein product [Rhizoctonia solani]|uniref:Endonuclease 3 n=1 Tax=Rhizoctonia solani TaxID=456999 RepID=A0A8H2Y219_9AGAM|nr:unnamed protein product [Rhizoctonia solani]
MRASSLTISLVSLISPTWGWGMSGHQITATIAQIYLLPSAREAVCNILRPTYKCNLAGVAAWPDEIKQDHSYDAYSNLHFVNAEGDDPPHKCIFGELGWKSEFNILKGIADGVKNVTNTNDPSVNRDHALRFLAHFLGDIHQPFHLTGQYLGANYVLVKWKNRNTDLHSVWDDSFISHQILFVNDTKYTAVLPTEPSVDLSTYDATRNQRIEAALKGVNYDPYIRYILLEGIYGQWIDEVQEWISCPGLNDTHIEMSGQSVLEKDISQFENPTSHPALCPFYWASQTHPLLCNSVWPEGLTNETERVELSKEYATRIRDAFIIEKQLAMGGVRLASVLNSLFGSVEDIEKYGATPLLT